MSASVVGCLFTSQDGTCVCVQHGYTVTQKQKHNKQLNHPWHRTGEQESGEKISEKSLLSLVILFFSTLLSTSLCINYIS